MIPEKLHFNKLIFVLLAVVLVLVVTSVGISRRAMAQQVGIPVPVSINALMVTLVDHSAHYIWDYSALERDITDQEWRAIEFYAIQLAAAGPLLTLGGSGELDAAWVASQQWPDFSRAMSNTAMMALDAAKLKDKTLLFSVGDVLVETCESCHAAFKPALPTEGIRHEPDYDHLYHLFDDN